MMDNRSSPQQKKSLFTRLFTGFFRLFFYLLYHQLAWTYDFVAWIVSLGRWKEWVFSTIPDLHGPKVLELGHGPGHLQAAMQEKGLDPYGLDESKQMGQLAYKKMKKKGLNPRLVNGYAQYAPFPDRMFSQIVATFPSEYIFYSNTLDEIHRLLVPGGELLVLPVAWIGGNSILERFASWLFRSTGQAPSRNQYQKHEDLLQSYATPFQTAGFEVRIEERTHDKDRLLFIHAIKPAFIQR